LPEEFKWLLFEGKQEAELGYFEKERDIDIIAETMVVSLHIPLRGWNSLLRQLPVSLPSPPFAFLRMTVNPPPEL